MDPAVKIILQNPATGVRILNALLFGPEMNSTFGSIVLAVIICPPGISRDMLTISVASAKEAVKVALVTPGSTSTSEDRVCPVKMVSGAHETKACSKQRKTILNDNPSSSNEYGTRKYCPPVAFATSWSVT